jgi:5-methyltetrahydropteroyltriglutamate--homocysteine methyltransferase
MNIPTEPIGSIPRSETLLRGARAFDAGLISREELDILYDSAVRETIDLFEATGSPVITDGEQMKPSFATYPLAGLDNIQPGGVTIPFADGHIRQLPRLIRGPFRYGIYASQYVRIAKRYARRPVKQAVISASALSLLYPQEGITGYSREAFLEDLLRENETDIRQCLEAGAYNVQIDFTEARLAIKLDPTKKLLKHFVDLNNKVLERFSTAERKRIGVHTCPGGDQDSTHSADVDYAELLPHLFELQAGNFYIQLSSEKDRSRVLSAIREFSKADQTIFVGVIDPISQYIETDMDVKKNTLQAAQYIPLERLGTTDDCGFSPFGDDVSTSRDVAFQKIRARIAGTQLAANEIAGSATL